MGKRDYQGGSHGERRPRVRIQRHGSTGEGQEGSSRHLNAEKGPLSETGLWQLLSHCSILQNYLLPSDT